MEQYPLVSVVVVTFNSSKTVIETLESIKSQTYRNIELIVSDDCSTDGTIEMINCWLNENMRRFVRAEFITAIQNTGPTANFNRGISKARGIWIKTIAGDDLLLSNCISLNIEYINDNVNTVVLFSRVRPFGNKEICKVFNEWCQYGFFNLSRRDKYIYILIENKVVAPSLFIRSDIIERAGGYDETIPFIEDWPFWIKLLKNGIDLSFFNKETVLYRTGCSLTSGGSQKYRDSIRIVNDYAYICQTEFSYLYKMHVIIKKKKSESTNLIIKYCYCMLLKLSPYSCIIKRIRWKIKKESRKLDKEFEMKQ